MLNNAIEGTTRRIGKEQGYHGLCVRDETIDGHPVMVTSWQPTPRELAVLVAGGSIRISILGHQHPPIMVNVHEVQP